MVKFTLRDLVNAGEYCVAGSLFRMLRVQPYSSVQKHAGLDPQNAMQHLCTQGAHLACLPSCLACSSYAGTCWG
jgi:hypothetical protein